MIISMDSTVMFNAACGVLFMHLAGNMGRYTGDREAYDLHEHQVDGKPILIAQSKLRLTITAHVCAYRIVFAPKHLLGGKFSSLVVA